MTHHPRSHLAPFVPFAALALIAAACAADAPDAPDAEVSERSQASTFGADNRAAITSLAYPYGAIGKFFSPAGSCTATLIASNKILTAQHCFGNGAGGLATPAQLDFYPAFGITTAGQPARDAAGNAIVAHGVRYTLGRDDDNVRGDWAVVTLDRNLTALGFQTMDLGPGDRPTPYVVNNAGYGGDLFSNRPGVHLGCQVREVDDNELYNDCDGWFGNSGGPYFWIRGDGRAEIVGVYALEHGLTGAAYSHANASVAAGGDRFYQAPQNAVGIATALTYDGRLQAFATDADQFRVSARWKLSLDASGDLTPWRDAVSLGLPSRIAATNLADGRAQVWAISGDLLMTRWETEAGVAWTDWTLEPLIGTPRDVAVTGGSGVTTHVFVLMTTGAVYVKSKLGDASSNWSSWQLIGSISGARKLAAAYFEGTHQVFVSYGSGISTSWGSASSFTALGDLTSAFSGYGAIAAGTLADGRAHVLAVDASGQLGHSVRAADGSSWSAWASFPVANGPGTRGAFTSLGTGKLTDGREQVFAIADGEIFSTWQLGSGWNGQFARFY